jgi:hypothetical protein
MLVASWDAGLEYRKFWFGIFENSNDASVRHRNILVSLHLEKKAFIIKP